MASGNYLVDDFGWFSAVFGLWNISLDGPAVVSQHTWTQLGLVLLFHLKDCHFPDLWSTVLFFHVVNTHTGVPHALDRRSHSFQGRSPSVSLRNVLLGIYIYIYIYRCLTTCGHYCRRWFPRSLWSKKVHINMCLILDGYGVMTAWNLE